MLIASQVGPIAKLDKMEFVPGLPKTRSGKIMRRILRKIAHGQVDQLGEPPLYLILRWSIKSSNKLNTISFLSQRY